MCVAFARACMSRRMCPAADGHAPAARKGGCILASQARRAVKVCHDVNLHSCQKSNRRPYHQSQHENNTAACCFWPGLRLIALGDADWRSRGCAFTGLWRATRALDAPAAAMKRALARRALAWAVVLSGRGGDPSPFVGGL